MDKKLAVVALGGNAILRGDQKGTMAEQNQNIREALENLIYLIRDGYNLIITHGNGPQVGNILLSDDAGVKMYGLPPMSLDMCVAYSQGQIGYMIDIAGGGGSARSCFTKSDETGGKNLYERRSRQITGGTRLGV